MSDMNYLLPEKAYKVLKWVGLIAMPAIATFTGTVGNACGWDGTSIAVTIITAAGTLIGALIGASQAKAKQSEEEE